MRGGASPAMTWESDLFGWCRGHDLLIRWQANRSEFWIAAEPEQESGNDRISGGHCWGDSYADRLSMHEAEESQHRAPQREGRGLHEFLLDDEGADRT